jgi:hypothetical protein
LIIALVASDARPIDNQHEADYRQHNQQPPTRSINIMQSPNADAETRNEGNQRECVAETHSRHDKALTLWNRLKGPKEKSIHDAENKRNDKNDEGIHPELSSRRAASEITPPPHYGPKFIHEVSPSGDPMHDGAAAFTLSQK